MSSYFSEHDCEPLANGEQPNHYLHFARLIATGGYWEVIIDCIDFLQYWNTVLCVTCVFKNLGLKDGHGDFTA